VETMISKGDPPPVIKARERGGLVMSITLIEARPYSEPNNMKSTSAKETKGNKTYGNNIVLGGTVITTTKNILTLNGPRV